MKQRGRKSAASKSVSSIAVIDGGRGTRMAPPADLNEYEAAKWAEVVNNMPADWFSPEMTDMLRAYCRVSQIVFEIDQTDKQLQKDLLGGLDVENLNLKLKLTASRDKQVRQMVLLARSLRLTPQSRQEPKTAHTAKRKHGEKSSAKQPWHG